MPKESWSDKLAHRHLQINEQDDGSFLLECRRRQAQLDLSEVPDGTLLTISFPNPSSGASSLTLLGPRDGHHITLDRSVSISIPEGRLGTLDYKGGASRAGTAPTLQGSVRDLTLHSGTLQLTGNAIETMHLAGGSPTGDTSGVATIEARGDVTLPNEVRHLRIVEPDANVRADGNGSVEELTFNPAPGSDITLTVSSNPRNPRTLRIATVRGEASLRLDGADVEVRRIDGSLEIGGRGTLNVPAGETLTDVTVHEPVALNLRPGAAVLRYTGQLRVKNVQHASVVAAPDHTYSFTGFARAGTGRQNGPEQLTGATLRGITIPDDAVGRRQLHQLREAAIVEPRLNGLRLRRLRWRVPGARLWLTTEVQRSRELDDAAFFAEELAAFVARKCGAGSVRTKASWAAYRGRHLNAESPWERQALSLYRLVGYGQRPGPPAALWLLLAAAAAVVANVTGWLSSEAVTGSTDPSLLEQFGVLALSPLFLLRLAGDPQLAQVAGLADLNVVLVRTVVAAPFVFLIIAVTRFLRAEWPWT